MRNMTSRLALAAALAAGLAGGLVAPAFADVDVDVNIRKTKDIGNFVVGELEVTFTETISITKNVTINTAVEVDILGAAEAQALANVVNRDNTLVYNDGEGGANPAVDSLASIDGGSLNFNTGVTGVNQDSGNFANQGNLVAVAIADTLDVFANSQAEADQLNNGNSFREGPDFVNEFSTNGADDLEATDVVGALSGSVVYVASINGALVGNEGIGVVGVNQNAGNFNNQLNAVAIAAGLTDEVDAADDDAGTIAAVSEAALGQVNGNDPRTRIDEDGNSVHESGTLKTASISGSLNLNSGAVIGVNQAAGNNANQANLVSVSTFVDVTP